jgi:hypothetical protein
MLWSVQWAAGPTGYRVMVCNKCRIVRKFYAESLAGDSIDDVRQQARDKAIELALKHRVPLANIIEDSPRGQGDSRRRRSEGVGTT